MKKISFIGANYVLILSTPYSIMELSFLEILYRMVMDTDFTIEQSDCFIRIKEFPKPNSPAYVNNDYKIELFTTDNGISESPA